MPWMNFDLQDGKPPVGFDLKADDCDRFAQFMAECDALRAEVESLTHQLKAGESFHAVAVQQRDAAWREAESLRAEVEALKTTMIAAAEEIHAHWPAHCDADGYGPANLMRRLEEGIPSEYGYTAGAFVALKAEVETLSEQRWRLLAEVDALHADAYRYRWFRNHSTYTTVPPCIHGATAGPSRIRWYHDSYQLQAFTLDAAIDAARAAQEGK